MEFFYESPVNIVVHEEGYFTFYFFVRKLNKKSTFIFQQYIVDGSPVLVQEINLPLSGKFYLIAP